MAGFHAAYHARVMWAELLSVVERRNSQGCELARGVPGRAGHLLRGPGRGEKTPRPAPMRKHGSKQNRLWRALGEVLGVSLSRPSTARDVSESMHLVQARHHLACSPWIVEPRQSLSLCRLDEMGDIRRNTEHGTWREEAACFVLAKLHNSRMP